MLSSVLYSAAALSSVIMMVTALLLILLPSILSDNLGLLSIYTHIFFISYLFLHGLYYRPELVSHPFWGDTADRNEAPSNLPSQPAFEAYLK